jgi:fused signal recognition particle receptor
VGLFNFEFGKKLVNVFSKDKLTDDAWKEIYETLIQADLGPTTTNLIITKLKKHNDLKNITEVDQAKAVLSEILVEVLEIPEKSSELNISKDGLSVFLIVGVNGTGKTTSVGKLAQIFASSGKNVVLAAADTFRAAAANQLATWASRAGVDFVQGEDNAEPASVAFRAVQKALENNANILLVDTAGRLHTKAGLMDELGKIKRVIEKQTPVNEVLLVIDATTGQNGLIQAKIFTEAVDVSGVILTKLDGSAKGGIVVAIAQELGVPVKFVGMGEGINDLKPFRATEFAQDLLN